MAVPLLHEERSLGVLEVLDRPARSAFTLDEMDLLGLFANQAAIALDLMARSRRARAALDGADPSLQAVARIARNVDELEGRDAEAGKRLLLALADVLQPGEERVRRAVKRSRGPT
jgi:GAF domain-containing protein